jgi:hypothetical protein
VVASDCRIAEEEEQRHEEAGSASRTETERDVAMRKRTERIEKSSLEGGQGEDGEAVKEASCSEAR